MRMTGLLLLATTLAMAGVPAAAQTDALPAKSTAASDEPNEADVMEMMRAMFQVEPLTPEQRARLPQAEAVIARMMPPGTLQQVMGGMFDRMLSPLGALASAADSDAIAKELGVEADALDLSDEDAERIGAMLDPARKERQQAEMAVVERGMTAAMNALEPGMRKGMAEAYAATFTTTELTDIDRFFTTPSGTAFATKSYALASDPRIMAAAMEGMPAMMEQMKTLEAEAKAAQAMLPARRGYAELSAEQRAEIARLTGLSQTAIREGMARAQAERARDDSDDASADEDADQT